MLKRREFCQLSLLAGLAGVAGCSRGASHPTLGAALEALPNELVGALPDPWKFEELEAKSLTGLSKTFVTSNAENADLFAIGDGWISEFSKASLQPIDLPQISVRLNKQTEEFLESFGPEISSRIFPIGVSPWVMLFRNGKQFLPLAQKSWDVLLEPGLTGKVVLPESPRLVMSIADQIDQTDGLRRLRKQSLTFDDKNGLNWLLSGRARVAILPLYRCLGSLSRDLRLSVAIPQSGTPLHWTLLLHPIKSREPFPESWIVKAWRMPLLGKLLARGWIPPINVSELGEAIDYIPNSYKRIFQPNKSFWEKSWSLSYLSDAEMIRLERLWGQSTP